MTVYAGIALVASLMIGVRAALNLYALRKSLKWLSANHKCSAAPGSRFFVCIPALNEQETIIATVESFLEQSYPKELVEIYIVTTAREVPPSGDLSTFDVVSHYIARSKKDVRDRVHVVNYPRQDGYMSHQINFVADHLRTKLAQPDAYFVVYNADSRIHTSTFRLVESMVASELAISSRRPTILQQSAVYQYTGGSFMAEGAGLHQTLWTLVHEIPRLLAQSSKVGRLRDGGGIWALLKYSRIAHCVGHGLFVRGEYYLKHPLPQDTLNEDLPYGLQACALREPICPVPSLELASTPNKLRNVYAQKSVWFNPFFEFIRYANYLLHQRLYVSKIEVVWLLAQAYSSLLVWLVHSVVLLGGLVFSSIAGWRYVLIWVAAYLMYWVVPSVIVTRTRRDIVNAGSNSYMSILGGVPYVLTHSVGPFIAVYHWITASIKGGKPSKQKTETL